MRALLIIAMFPLLGIMGGCATALYLDDPTIIMEGPGLDVTWNKP